VEAEEQISERWNNAINNPVQFRPKIGKEIPTASGDGIIRLKNMESDGPGAWASQLSGYQRRSLLR
jgi:hypothetical protein